MIYKLMENEQNRLEKRVDLRPIVLQLTIS